MCNSSNFTGKKGITNDVDVILEDLPFDYFPINCNQLDSVSIYIYCNNILNAPLSSNSAIGYLTISIANKTILTLQIKNSNSIEQKDYLDFWNNMIKSYTYHLESLLYKNI